MGFTVDRTLDIEKAANVAVFCTQGIDCTEDAFREELNCNYGSITINGRNYWSADILADCDPQFYRLEYKKWTDGHLKHLLSIAQYLEEMTPGEYRTVNGHYVVRN